MDMLRQFLGRRRNIRWITIIAVMCAVGIGVLRYCYGPILPMKMHGITTQWSYYRGWLDASREAMRGGFSYSFYRYSVLGISEYAQELDGIGICSAPQDVVWEPGYFEGFNRRMEARIRKKVGVDFPEGYIQRYLEKGWLDISKGHPAICHLHNLKMELVVVPVEIVYPFTIPRPRFAWEVARDEFFPFSGMTSKMDASLLPRPNNVRAKVCAECTEAERLWWISYKGIRL